MAHTQTPRDNLICLRALTAKTISKMNTYNYAGFVGSVTLKGDLYIISEITGKPQITGHGETVEKAILSFEKAVREILRETAKDSQRKMLIRRFAKAQTIHSRINAINQAELKRRVDRAKRMENCD